MLKAIQGFIKDIPYRIRLGCLVITYKINYELNDLIIKLFTDDTIEFIERDGYDLKFSTSKYNITLWDGNQYSGWLGDGKIVDKNTSIIKLEWKNIGVTAKCMCIVKDQCVCHEYQKLSNKIRKFDL